MSRIINQYSPSQIRSNNKQEQFDSNLPVRHRRAKTWHLIFQISTVIGIVVLMALLYNIINQAFGFVAFESKVNPDSLAMDGISLENLSKEDLIRIIQDKVTASRFRTLEKEKPFLARSHEEVYSVVIQEVVKPKVADSWSLFDSLFHRKTILVESAEKYPQARLEFHSWIGWDTVTTPESSSRLNAGVRAASLGCHWPVAITILVAFPIGVGAAIYLEEYATQSWISRIIQTNINNLAGVPSIIYGMLGLAIFVRAFNLFTSGAAFGYTDPANANGRTILSAGLTLALLILPLLIINSQEAIRAVPSSLRQASFSLGATKWQTVWYHVLPNAIPGILTGSILAISRAIGETAPLVVIGASTFITFDPDSLFSKFTSLPIQIYQWTSRPQAEFRNLAAAAIIILLILLLGLNASAILLRNRFNQRVS